MARYYITLKELSEMQTEIDWIWRDLILRGHITILGSRGGVGKSSLALWIAYELAKENLTTLYIDAERTGTTHGERAKNWGFKDEYKEKIIFHCEEDSEQKDERRLMPGPVDNNALLAAALEVEPDLIIIDSMTFDAVNIKGKDREEVIRYCSNLKLVAAKQDCAVLLLVHANKKTDFCQSVGLDSLYGSGGLTDAARSVLVIDYVNQETQPDRRLIKQVKSNYGPLAADLEFTLNENGISDMIPFQASVRTSGLKSKMCEEIVRQGIKTGLNENEIRDKLLLALPGSGGEATTRSRAFRKVSKELNINWKG